MRSRRRHDQSTLRSISTTEQTDFTKQSMTIDPSLLSPAEVRSKHVEPIYILQQLKLPSIRNPKEEPAASTRSPQRQHPASLIEEYLQNYRAKRSEREKDKSDVAHRIREMRQHRYMPNGSSKSRQLQKITMRRQPRRRPKSPANEAILNSSNTIDVSIPAVPWHRYSPRKTNSEFVRGPVEIDLYYL